MTLSDLEYEGERSAIVSCLDFLLTYLYNNYNIHCES